MGEYQITDVSSRPVTSFHYRANSASIQVMARVLGMVLRFSPSLGYEVPSCICWYAFFLQCRRPAMSVSSTAHRTYVLFRGQSTEALPRHRHSNPPARPDPFLQRETAMLRWRSCHPTW